MSNKLSESAEKKLRLMTFWLFGSVLIIWAAIVVYYGLWLSQGAAMGWGSVLMTLSPGLIVIAIVAGIIYAVYRYVFLPRQSA